MIQEEFLALGCVKSVSKFFFDVQILQGEVGRVSIYDVSDPYSNMLKEMVESGESNDNVPSLKDMFRIGDNVRCYVKSVNAKHVALVGGQMSDQKRHIELSVNPKDVNKHIHRKHIRSFSHFVAAVSSVEDHVYVIDTEFLPVGSLVTVRPLLDASMEFISSEDIRVLEVTLDLGDSNSLIVCLWLDAVIQEFGSTVTAIFQEYVISINRNQCTEHQLHQNMNVVVCLIGTDPNTKQLVGSLLPHLLPSSGLSPSFDCTQVAVGTRFTDACIARVDKRTLHLTLPGFDRVRALVHRAHIPSEVAGSSLRKKFNSGQKVTTRIIDHDLLANVAIATMNKKLLNLPYLVIDELSPGDKIKAVVKRFTKSGIVVRVEERFNGLVSYLNLTDVPLKHPEEKFSCGEQISCRVLSVNAEDKKLVLSAKRSIVEADKSSLFGYRELSTSSKETYKKCESTDIYYAIIVKVSERGLLLSGLNDLRGWLPRRETGLSDTDVLEKTFYRGQVLKVRILRLLPQPKRMASQQPRSRFLLSLKISQPQSRERTRKLKDKGSIVSIGQVFYAKVTKAHTTGITVDLHAYSEKGGSDLSPTITSGFLSYVHLSDHVTNTNLLRHSLSRLKSGSLLKLGGEAAYDEHQPRGVVVIQKINNNIFLSARPSLVTAALRSMVKSDEEVRTGFVRDFSDLLVGSQWYAWVVSHAEYGVFVQLPSGVRGLAPVRFLTDSRQRESSADWKSLFPLNSTVVAKVVELAPSEKRRCLVSLRLLDTYFARDDYLAMTLSTTPNGLTERRWVIERHYQHLSQFAIGDLVHFRVTRYDSPIIEGEVSHSTDPAAHSTWQYARVCLENTEGVDCYPESIHTALVSLIDLSAPNADTRGCVEVVLSTWLVNAVKNRKENLASALQPDQHVSSVVVAVVPGDLAVVAFRGHAAGRFGVLPTRRSFNDVTGPRSILMGQRNQVTLRQSFTQSRSNAAPLFLCTMTMYDPIGGYSQFGSSDATSPDVSSGSVLKPGAQLSQLHFTRLVGDIAFFHASSNTKGQALLCRVVNLDDTISGIRAFLAHPPAVGTIYERTATVIRSADDDQRLGTHCRKGLQSRLPEISFLSRSDCPAPGDLVHAQIIAKHPDVWLLRLAGGWPGRLHITGMVHSKPVQPLTIGEQSSRVKTAVHARWPVGVLAKPQFIRCRVVDCAKTDGEQPESCSAVTGNEAAGKANSDSQRLCYVSTRSDVIRNGLDAWLRRKPASGIPTEGFVTRRSSNGLVVAVTHEDNVLIPFTTTLRNRLKALRIRFRLGDHLCVLPERVVGGHLVARLIFADEENVDDASSDLPNDNDLLDMLSTLTGQVGGKRKRAISPEPGNDALTLCVLSPPVKRPRTEKLTGVRTQKAAGKRSVEPVSKTCKKENTKRQQPTLTASPTVEDENWSLSKPHLVDRYKKFMLPATCVDQPEETIPENTDLPSHKQVKIPVASSTPASAEWKLREAELHTAMLAALTREQEHQTPKRSSESVVPQTTEDFELAVRNAPEQAGYWTAYMSHVLASNPQNGLTQARALAERGLSAISRCPITSDNEQEVQQARLLSFCLVLEAKELQRYAQQSQLYSISDPLLEREKDEQASRLSLILTRLVALDQAPYTRRAINSLTEIGQHERAEELARRLIKASPRDADRWLTLIRVRLLAGCVAAAREAQRNATSVLRPAQLPHFLTSVARLEFEFGDVDRAIGLFVNQLATHSKHASVYEEYIKLLLATGRLSEANAVKQQAGKALKPAQMKVIDALFSRMDTLKEVTGDGSK